MASEAPTSGGQALDNYRQGPMAPEAANRMWGEGNWVHHEGCGTHHVDFHQSPRMCADTDCPDRDVPHRPHAAARANPSDTAHQEQEG